MDDHPGPGGPAAWRLDEVASAGRENLDPGHVARYDDKEDARAADEVELLRTLGLEAASTVVDLGAGTGQFTVAVAPWCARAVAVDVSPVMLDRLATKVAGLPNVELARAGFLSYEHRGAPADVVYSRWALHHLPDFWKVVALARLRSILRTGGLLRLVDIAYSFGPQQAEERIEAWRASFPAEAGAGEWARGDIDEHVRDEHSTFTWLLESMIERNDFRIERAEHSSDGLEAAYVARAV